jgi:hypothetical protein
MQSACLNLGKSCSFVSPPFCQLTEEDPDYFTLILLSDHRYDALLPLHVGRRQVSAAAPHLP